MPSDAGAMSKREREVLRWMGLNTPKDCSAAWYADQIVTSARLLHSLERKGFVRRHDPSVNFFTRSGSAPIRWSLTVSGQRIAALTGYHTETTP